MKHDIKNIETFAYVAKFKNFSKVASILKVSRAIITNRIADLEKTMKVSLVNRTPREVELTNDGKNFLILCEEIMSKIEKIDYFVENSKGISGTLKIAIPPYYSRHNIVPYIKEFLDKYPNLKLDITLTENPINIVSQGYDLQIRNQISEEENLEVSILSENSKVLCTTPQYIMDNPRPENPRDLLKHNCIIFAENEAWKFKHKVTGDMTEIKDMSGNIKCDNGEIIKELILSGNGITIKSKKDIEEELKNGSIVELLTDYEALCNTKFYIVYPSNKYLSPKIKAFISFFQEKLLS